MKLINASHSYIEVLINIRDLRIIKNSLNEVLRSISGSEISTRTGCSINIFNNLIIKINEHLIANHNNVLKDENGIEFSFTKEELRAVTQSFNEVCNGIHISNFEERIGMEREELYVLLFEPFKEWRKIQRDLCR